jgi:hypothetical protein
VADFKFTDFETRGAVGMDALFASDPSLVTQETSTIKRTASRRVKVGSLTQLNGFERVSSETLIHTSTRDLWAIQKEDDGEFYIARLFNDDGNPQKG